MLALTFVLGGAGLGLLLGGRLIARGLCHWKYRGTVDPVALEGFIRHAGILLLLLAALVRPHHPETSAFRLPVEEAVRSTSQ